MEENCLLCDKILCSPSGVTTVGLKGMRSLLLASERRKDNLGSKLRGIETIRLHTECRKKYTRDESITALQKQQSAADPSSSAQGSSLPQTRSSVKTLFEFKIKCFFCADIVDEEYFKKQLKKPIKARRDAFYCRSKEMITTVLNAADRRNDEKAQEVRLRLSGISDLVAANGVYHLDCYQQFVSHKPPEEDRKRGRPEADYIRKAMEEIYSLIENCEECQFSFEQLRSAVSGDVPSNDTIKRKLKDKYGKRIIIAVGVGWRDATICFNDVGFKILKSWYDDRKADESDERLRIVQAAAKIIRQDVQGNVYDATVYPPGNNFLKEAASCVPPTLRVFLETLIMKKADNVNKKRKCISIAHSIISAIRPISFVSSIMNSVALFVYRRFASKKLVNLLSSLGFSASYHCAQQLEMSAINYIQPDTDTSFQQFVFDNADFNVRTLDGFNTFHSMGGIKCVPSGSTTGIEHEKPIPRLTKVPPPKTVGELGVIPLQTYQKSQGGLSNVIVEDLTDIVKTPNQLTLYDTLWLAAKWLNIKCVPEWKGFMYSITKGLGSEKTKVIPIPF